MSDPPPWARRYLLLKYRTTQRASAIVKHMKAKNPVLYVHMESRERELDAKLLVALAAAELGFISIFGQSTFLLQYAKWFPEGIYFFKGLNLVETNVMQICSDNQRHTIIAIDEESLGVADSVYLAKGIHPVASKLCDLVFAQGEAHREVLKPSGGFSDDQIAVTGNPRIDLLRPPLNAKFEREAKALRKRLGKFVLVNTNTGAVNSTFGDLEQFKAACKTVGWLDPHDPDDQADFDAWITFEKANMAATEALVYELRRALPDYLVLLRPHPSERKETWEDKFSSITGVLVERSGNHIAWMLASQFVFHTSCTTGVEAELAGVPAISIKPHDATAAHWFLSNQVNPVVSKPSEAVMLAKSFLVNGCDPFSATADARRALLARQFALGEPGFAFDRIAQSLLNLLDDPKNLSDTYRWPEYTLRHMPKRSTRQMEKFSATMEEVQARINTLADCLGRFHDLRLVEAWDSLFAVSRPDKLTLPDDGQMFRLKPSAA